MIVPIHHHTYNVPDADLVFTGGCHQCSWTARGNQASVITVRQEHETSASREVESFWSAR